MPLYHSVTYTNTGTETSVNMDPSIAPFNASVRVTLASTGNYKIQFTLAGESVADADALWFDSVNIPAGTTSSATTNLMFPVSRVRIVISANGSSITLETRQGYTTN